eukprot:TRINITY_DN14513_c0_g1_i1.p3 TRINITY_DN14513_c0_g1~~TRINITY_DN14513_c0_g1_i1.p3  ORF type:complete len:152 (+),score=37.46 TRINITY_DN14513_c0_g1_i1:817-1272(+)
MKLEEKNSLKAIDKENAELKGRLRLLNKENEELEGKIHTIRKQQEEDMEQERDLASLKGKLEGTQKLHKRLAKIHRDILSLSKAVAKIFEGQDPNIQSLWGTLNTESDISLSNASSESILDDTGSLKIAVDAIRTSICDYYADKYSNHCTY